MSSTALEVLCETISNETASQNRWLQNYVNVSWVRMLISWYITEPIYQPLVLILAYSEFLEARAKPPQTLSGKSTCSVS